MPLFRFVAKDAFGKKFTGEVEATDQNALVKILQQEQLVPIEVKSKDQHQTISLSILKFGKGVSDSEVVNFTRQLSTMVSAGLAITDALLILQKQTKSNNFSRILGEVV